MNKPNQSAENLSPEEKEILRKIEEQNRLLEADRKSLQAIPDERSCDQLSMKSGSRSASPKSLTSVNSVTFTPAEVEDLAEKEQGDRWNLWGKIVTQWEEYRKRDSKQMKELIRQGIPHHFRAIAWQLLTDAHNAKIKDRYSELLKKKSPFEKLIRRDISRTYPDHEFFKSEQKNGQEVLFNVIKAYSLVDREVGYCQGSAFIVGLFLMNMPEEEAFTVFVSLMNGYKLRDLYKPTMEQLGLCLYQLECILEEVSPVLFMHFKSQGFHTSMYASPWFLTLCTTTFNEQLASRIMDIFLCDGMEIIFRVALVMLLARQQELVNCDMEGMLGILTKELPLFFDNDPDLLIQKAYIVKYSSKKLKKFEKDYLSTKSREKQDQEEIKNLQMRNRMQSEEITRLQKENEELASRLINDRVNHAVESEQKIRMGRELSIARRQAKVNSIHDDDGISMKSSDRASLTSNDVLTNHTEEFVLQLQEELIQARLQKAESMSALSDLQDKVSYLQSENKRIIQSSNTTELEQHLTAIKLREAEANETLKSLAHKIKTLEENWQHHMSRVSTIRSSKGAKTALQEAQEEILNLRLKETKMIAQHTEVKQKYRELETNYQVCSSHLKRSADECKSVHDRIKAIEKERKVIQQNLNEANAKLVQVQSESHDAILTLRLKEADSTMTLAEAKQEITKLNNKVQEFETLHPTTEDGDHKVALSSLTDTSVVVELQRKVVQQQNLISKLLQRRCAYCGNRFTYNEENHDSDESSDCDIILDTTLNDSEQQNSVSPE